MNIKKFFSALTFAGALSLVFYENFSDLFSKPLLRAVIESQGFKLLLEIKKDPFNKWKRTFVTNKDSLLREGILPYLDKNSTDDEGAYYLNRWCADVLNSKNWDNLTFWRTRKYCTVNWGVEILEGKSVRLIDELDDSVREQEWKKVFIELKHNISRAGLIEGLDINRENQDINIALFKDWCTNRLSESFNYESLEEGKLARSWCVTLDTPKIYA